MKSLVLLFFSIIFPFSISRSRNQWENSRVEVNCTAGLIVGIKNDRFAKFLGIPYAEPPVGKLRFKPPVPKSKLFYHEALEYSPECYQSSLYGDEDDFQNKMYSNEYSPYNYESNDPSSKIFKSSSIQDEDCLYLNIWVPIRKRAFPVDSMLPVMIWIHGGAFVHGSANNALYSGEHLIKNNVIIVNLNYRLGIFVDLIFSFTK